jgi:hypothetical protein
MRSVHSEMVTTSRPSWKTAPSLDCDIYIINNTLTVTANNLTFLWFSPDIQCECHDNALK